LTGLLRGLKPEPLHEPVIVVALAEFLERRGQFLQRREVSHPEQLFLEGAEEALDAAVAFGLPDKGGRGGDARKGDLTLEVVAHESRAVIMPQPHAAGAVFCEAAELLMHRAADRLQRLRREAAA